MAMKRNCYRSVVIGAGPSGLAAVANLLDSGIHPLLWVDPSFTAGRLSRYQLVPSNTKIQLFIDFTLASPTLSRIVSNSSPSPLQDLQAMNPSGTCLLKHTVHLVSSLSSEVKRQLPDKVHCFQGWAHHVALQDHKSATWSVALGKSKENATSLTLVDTPAVIFATGAHPTSLPPSSAPHEVYSSGRVEQITLEAALDPPALTRAVSGDDTVAVVGSSHSAVLCLKNLAELENKPRKIIHYYRQELKYAVQMDGWILYDNTGLKGEAASWAKQVLEPGLEPLIESHNLCDSSTSEASVYERSMKEVTKIIYAIGFTRNELPKLVIPGASEDEKKVGYSGTTGKLMAGENPLPGLWGFGIAFPEQVVDPHGNREASVGLWKFMRYMKKVVPEEVVPELEKNFLRSNM